MTLAALDAHLLDRVFQPGLDCLARRWGVTLHTVKRQLALGFVTFIEVSLLLTTLDHPLLVAFTALTAPLFLVGLWFGLRLIAEEEAESERRWARGEAAGANPRRLTMQDLRVKGLLGMACFAAAAAALGAMVGFDPAMCLGVAASAAMVALFYVDSCTPIPPAPRSRQRRLDWRSAAIRPS